MTYTLTKPTTQPASILPYAFAAEEDRCAPRFAVAIPGRLRFSCSQSFSVEVTDISLAGFACDALLQIHSGTRCWLTLPGLGALEAETVRHDHRGMACAFTQMINPAVMDRYIEHYPAPELEEIEE